jgi:hypothetical protein
MYASLRKPWGRLRDRARLAEVSWCGTHSPYLQVASLKRRTHPTRKCRTDRPRFYPLVQSVAHSTARRRPRRQVSMIPTSPFQRQWQLAGTSPLDFIFPMDLFASWYASYTLVPLLPPSDQPCARLKILNILSMALSSRNMRPLGCESSSRTPGPSSWQP